MLRVQSADGTVRVQMQPKDTTTSLYERVHDEFHLTSFSFILAKERSVTPTSEIASSKSTTLADCGLKHGDMIFLTPLNGAIIFNQPSTSDSVQVRLYFY